MVDYIVANTVGEKLKIVKEDFIAQENANRDALARSVNVEERAILAGLLEENALKFIQEKILTLSVLDPAMGSGHFLVNVTNLIANFITEFLNGLNIEGETPSSTTYWRRWVVESCIYGVDLNPLAVELAKLSLWILSMAKDQPLSFMNHHLKCGNSLFGTRLEEIGNYPLSTAKSEPHQINMFERDPNLRVAVEEAITKSHLIASRPSTSLDDLEEKKAWLEDIESQLAVYKSICNLHTSLYFENNDISEEQYNEIIQKINIDQPHSVNEENRYFHWELEYPEIFFKHQGFEIVIGNPPYVRSSTNALLKNRFSTANGRNLYAWFIELSFMLTHEKSVVGMIVPLSLMISKQMTCVRTLFLQQSGHYKFSNFDNIPDCIFNAGKESANTNKSNSQRTTIFIVKRSIQKMIIESTDLLRWQKGERRNLFRSLDFADVTEVARKEHFPMIGNQELVPFLEKLQSSGKCIKDLTTTDPTEDDRQLFIPTRARYFIPASPEDFHRNNQMTLSFSNDHNFHFAFILISSNVFYWYWRVFGDGFDVAARDVLNFPLPTLQQRQDEIKALATKLETVIPECRVFKKK